jgi:hypothetical protein
VVQSPPKQTPPRGGVRARLASWRELVAAKPPKKPHRGGRARRMGKLARNVGAMPPELRGEREREGEGKRTGGREREKT